MPSILFAEGIRSNEQIFDTRPIHSRADLFHSCDSPVMFHRRKERNTRKGQVSFYFFEAINSCRVKSLVELRNKNGHISSNISMLSLYNDVL